MMVNGLGLSNGIRITVNNFTPSLIEIIAVLNFAIGILSVCAIVVEQPRAGKSIAMNNFFMVARIGSFKDKAKSDNRIKLLT